MTCIFYNNLSFTKALWFMVSYRHVGNSMQGYYWPLQGNIINHYGNPKNNKQTT